MPRIFFVVIILIFNFNALTAQPYDEYNAKRKGEIAEEKYLRGDLYNAADCYERAYRDDPKNPFLLSRLAWINYRIRDYEAAQAWYTNLLAHPKGETTTPEARFYYAKTLKINGMIEEAEQEFTTFLATYNGAYSGLKTLAANELKGIELVRNADRSLPNLAHPLNKYVNSSFSEFSPLAVSDNELYFSGLRSDTLIILSDDRLQRTNVSNIYCAKRNKLSGDFDAPQLVPNLNATYEHTGNTTVSADKKIIFVTRYQLNNNVVSHADLYRSSRQNTSASWDAPTLVTELSTETAITKHPAIGRWKGRLGLFFVSNRAGGYGGFDVYFASSGNDGNFGAVENLGANYNTVGNEEAPFYELKSNTLYYSSDGLPGIGSYDVFSVRDAQIVNPEPPQNLGAQVNTPQDDLFFTLNEAQTTAYLASNRIGAASLRSQTCCDDIFVLDYKNIAKPATKPTANPIEKPAATSPVVDNMPVKTTPTAPPPPTSQSLLVAANIGNSGQKTKSFKLRYTNLTTNKTNITTPDEKGLVMLQNLSVGDRYQLYLTETEAYYADSSTVSIENNTKDAQNITFKRKEKPKKALVTVNIDNVPRLPRPTFATAPRTNVRTLAMRAIYWDFGKTTLTPTAARALDSIAVLLNENMELDVEVASHADSKGTAERNQEITEQRSQAAIEYLAAKGISLNRLQAVGYGASAPVAPNSIDGKDNEAGRAQNRRTEFKVIEGLGR